MADTMEARVPDIGDFHEVPVIEILVGPGDAVTKDQGLITLESDKATMEVPAPVSGIVRKIEVKLGETVSAGHVVALIETAGSASAAPPASVAAAPAPVAAPPVAARAAAPAAVVRAESSNGKPGSPPIVFGAESVMPDKVPYASPAVRAFARGLGVDLTKVTGTGRGGRIGKEDVRLYVKGALAAAPAVPARGGGLALDLPPWPKVDFARFGQIEIQPLSRIQKLSGPYLARNWVAIPHVTQHEDADVTDLEAWRMALNKDKEHEKAGIRFTMLAFLVKAVVAALKKFPTFNASLDDSGENLIVKKYFHIGFAADTPNGLVVPVLRNADAKGVVEIARETAALALKAREGKLAPEDMAGGCFSISSLGGIGGTSFTPIVNAPEVAILGVSRSAIRPVWDGKTFAPRLILPLSLSYDHRVIDGALAARFVAHLAQLLADLRRVTL